jgi:ADP-heptose:LPS heptosyltransferase
MDEDRLALSRCDADVPATGTYACIVPGKQSSFAWSIAGFAAFADRLAGAGLRIVLAGAAGESSTTRAIRDLMRMPALELAGKTDLGALAALVADARLLICGEVGVTHIAAGVATPSIAIGAHPDAQRRAPLNRRRHRLITLSRNGSTAGGVVTTAAEVESVWQEMEDLLAEEYGSGLTSGRQDTGSDADLLAPRR